MRIVKFQLAGQQFELRYVTDCLRYTMGRLSRKENTLVAQALGIKPHPRCSDRDLQLAVGSALQNIYYGALGDQETVESFKTRHERRILKVSTAPEVEIEVSQQTGKAEAKKKERKPREMKKFRFVLPAAKDKLDMIAKKKGQAKIALDILQAESNKDRIWTAAELAAEMRVHPDLPPTLKSGKTEMSEKEALKCANYYIFDLRNNLHCIQMLS